MTNRLICTLICSASAVFATAQRVDLGLRAGVNNSTIVSDTDYGRQTGMNIGVVAGINITNYFYVQPGLFYSMKGATRKWIDSPANFDIACSERSRLNYVEIPVSLGFKIRLGDKVSALLYTGPYYGIGANGYRKTKKKYPEDIPIKDKEEKKSAFGYLGGGPKGEDIGVNFGGGLRIRRIYLGLQYDLGLYDFMPGEERMRNRSFSGNVGYYFW